MLASALAGRTVAVVESAAGETAWTDGVTIFVDGTVGAAEQLEMVAVQASLLAGGGLDADVVRPLLRRRAVARRYLAVEGHRALSANEDLLPLGVRARIDLDLAGQVDSPAASLALASGRVTIADPLASFGVIKARRLLAAHQAASRAEVHSVHAPRRESGEALAELPDDGEAADAMMDPFSSPVGGGGGLGKLLQRMLSRVRRLSDGGTPGADSPTHRSRSGRGGAGAVTSVAAAPSDADDVREAGSGRTYPEWDVHRRRYRADWCTVYEIDPPGAGEKSLPRPDVHALRRPLTRLGIGLDRCHRQAQGDDIDTDAAVESRVELLAGSVPDEAVYLDNLRRRRDLAVLVLLDVSGSAGEAGAFGQNVHEQQQATAAALTIALHELGDRVALYAFQSQGRTAVNLMPVKRFDDGLDVAVMRRLAALRPGAYSRLGAAIRHGTSVATEQGGTTRRLLVVLSDGLAYDHGYERTYGAADARRALTEARRQGIGCLCLTIGAVTDRGELRRVFGSAAHASIPKPRQLPDVVGPLFRAALRSADLRRRVS
ncbi:MULTISPECIES: nitric oxide reductase activation protein NorD [unclassified Mycolicibacterium]|uniref:nitric oxide reductase activation protein NorD n=1 Tax=unclassified Mycolicibacterium TaxID=2636767 RepID=UPI0012DFE54E|nr:MULTISPECIES: VWA domain-containing protein [unclassified Mycolicibacterium]MUL83391.1 VWA domain-containing protein [Mycolicibacterium sp. CBMA 329]MUL90382.1 VWA domain-containing protein [Mycolicibacterium sp. CBMA 331]MUM00355.1 VWA domain-containing protein [Mycolicibacterium sp. CBMA 334]MUM27642.1 VWA domain-containing protein [Mycolicibacterium sp. CBMA 295]MUM41326.1 VWA domain-containing protein [Mycolicibacterium sp. CBMA 247]